ncbi:hypothetical protein KDL01_24850 [Actinospica durhamensis]|uniref:Uncharacterized protein n=1 Tax=Actinospica durhamensis TaxID=1508375 RepID=A0A941IV66_9ACTN|nr:hypothetical protein [Actinospica durhamensis]MBR7836531.1 hypothetical protein [Actinospica durhamensis]
MNGRNQSQYQDLAPDVTPRDSAESAQPQQAERPRRLEQPPRAEQPGRRRRGLFLTIPLRLLAAAGLAVDAYVHADLAGGFDTGGTLSETRLFLIQASLAAAAALGIVVRGRRLEAAVGFLIAAAAVGAVLLYRYVNVGKLGPLPNMYDPAWYTEKTISLIAEAVAVLACAGLLAVRQWQHRRARLDPGQGSGMAGRLHRHHAT